MSRRILCLILLFGTAVPSWQLPWAAPPRVTDYRLRVVKVHPVPFGSFSPEMRWSPDGTRIAVASRGIFVWDDPLRGVPRKIDDSHPHDFSWTADGRKLVFSRLRRGRPRDALSELFVFDPAEGAVRRIRAELGFHFSPLIPLQDSVFASIDRIDVTPSRPRFLDTSGDERSRKDALDFDLSWKADDGIWTLPAGGYETVRIPIQEPTWLVSAPLHGGHLAVDGVVEKAVVPVIFDHAGRAGKHFPFGFFPYTWSRSGDFVMGVIGTDDGHLVSSGEIMLCDATSGECAQLTDTPEVIEFGVDWCEASGHLVYSDERTGDVYIAVLETR